MFDPFSGIGRDLWLRERISEWLLAGGWQPESVENEMEKAAEILSVDLRASVRWRKENMDASNRDWKLVPRDNKNRS